MSERSRTFPVLDRTAVLLYTLILAVSFSSRFQSPVLERKDLAMFVNAFGAFRLLIVTVVMDGGCLSGLLESL